MKSHWMMVVMDQFSRKMIGLAVHPGILDGPTVCRLFNQIISGQALPKYLMTHSFTFTNGKPIKESLMSQKLNRFPAYPTHIPLLRESLK